MKKNEPKMNGYKTNYFDLVREKLVKVIRTLESERTELIRVIISRERLEGKQNRFQDEIERLKAEIRIKVSEELNDDGKSRYSEAPRRQDEVICRLVDDARYRSFVNRLENAQPKILRLKVKEESLKTYIKRLESEERLLFIEIENCNHE